MSRTRLSFSSELSTTMSLRRCALSAASTYSVPKRRNRSRCDGLQCLNIRTVLGGGLGFHAIKRESTTLDFLGGANYTHENYTQETPTPVPPNFQPKITRNLAAATIGDQFMHKLSKSTEITQDAFFYPDFTSGGDYRATFDLGTVTKISKWLGWHNRFGDVYVTNPPTGKKKNDIVFTTGLNVTFKH